jgi:hypothetical protein
VTVLGPNVTAAFDFALRLAFFSFVPFLIVRVAALFPVTGALVQIALAMVVFFAGEAVQRLAARTSLAKVLLSSQLAFEEYYRAHPPRPFLYYVFYPLLAPYWIVVPEARREFLLFKGYTLASFLLLLVSLAIQYFVAFPPELAFRAFFPIAMGTLAAEAVVVLLFLMPIVTSVVHLHKMRAPVRLSLLLLAGAISVSAAVVRLSRRRDPVVSYETRVRARLRSAANRGAALAALAGGLSEAWKALPRARADVDTDGKVEGAPLEKAHQALATFYKNDEAHAFDLWYTRRPAGSLMVVYLPARRGLFPIWLAMDRKGSALEQEDELPPGAFEAMRQAAQ